MKPVVLVTVALALSGCGNDFKTISAEVEIVGSPPPAAAIEKSNAVVYRVITPSALAGKYGVEFTALSAAEVEKNKGTIFKIQRLGKWRHLLSATPPKASSMSHGDDFFAGAVRK